MGTKRQDIRTLSKRHPKLETLMNRVDKESLIRQHRLQKKDKAPGIDMVTKEVYQENLNENIDNLMHRLKSFSYKPQPVRRVEIDKGNGKKRPLGIPVYEDRLFQGAMADILSDVYEPRFLDCSYGFRPNRSTHDAIKVINDTIMYKKVNYILDCDIKGFFDNVNHEWLMKFLRNDIADPNYLRYIARMLKSGVMIEGKYEDTSVGTPQGGLISPILANVYLHYVLDLCAAPGGKSTQIASHLKSGYLVSNEIDAKRAQILLSNIERMGVKNVAVTNTSVDKLAKVFDACFDKILVDAPCSGEGMIKKHDIALNNWSIENIELCATRQKEILEHAYSMLKPGGTLVYSTCTYALEEDEDVVLDFLDKHEDMVLVDPEVSWGRKGLKDLNVRRIFPMDGGEGHFIAKFKKQSGVAGKLPVLKSKKIDKITEKFLKEQLNTLPNYYYIDKDRVYGMDVPFVDFKKVKVLRQGVYLGDVIKNRFEPSHSFYMVADFDYKRKVDVTLEEMDLFMHGEVLQKECEKGYVAVCFKGHPFGFGKSDGKQIKNKIPKGLRLLPNSHVNID